MYTKNKLTKIANTEQARLYELLDRAGVPDHKQKVLQPIVEQLAAMRAKLDEAREQMQSEFLTCEYNNGGGQEGIRQNPFFKAYTDLMRCYLQTFERFTSALPAEMQEEVKGKENVLVKVQRMKKGSA